ncbi:uncharacterized protein PRCAT00000845001 [Priceomyces carsonii]|uniref:uncharacterized protein n=1 Tax=Priceomyces carsonii TaxID=28549 RepID=UPI002EDBA560|nr:unnamed protein product [Priceomyces carsonii]
MSNYSVYQQTTAPKDHTYKLLQLTPELLTYMKDHRNKELVIKATEESKNQLVLCTEGKTWRIRQMNHSNTVILLEDSRSPRVKKELGSDSLLGFSRLSYEYELSKTIGQIHINHLPVYDGESEIESSRSVNDLLNNSLISREQFNHEWHQLGGCQINGKAVILAPKLISEGLYLLIQMIIANNIDYKKDSVNFERILLLMHNHNNKFTDRITWTILNKFGTKEGDGKSFKLDNKAISVWFGIESLHNTSTKLLSTNDFLLAWKTSLPPFYTVPIDINYLRGYFYRPSGDIIRFLDPMSLTQGDLNSRIQELFKVTNEWDYDDFYPFISRLIPPGKKPESYVLKYAKKKRVGKNKFIVCPR